MRRLVLAPCIWSIFMYLQTLVLEQGVYKFIVVFCRKDMDSAWTLVGIQYKQIAAKVHEIHSFANYTLYSTQLLYCT